MEKNKLSIFLNGFIRENPILVLILGTCPTLAVSTQASNGIGMGLSVTVVLTFSNIFISALKKIIPDQVRIPCYIVVISTFVTLVQFVLQAYFPDLNKALGVYIPLIVVNCIILGRAEAFANKNSVVDATLDGLGMGLGSKTTSEAWFTDQFAGSSEISNFQAITGASFSSRGVYNGVSAAIAQFAKL